MIFESVHLILSLHYITRLIILICAPVPPPSLAHTHTYSRLHTVSTIFLPMFRFCELIFYSFSIFRSAAFSPLSASSHSLNRSPFYVSLFFRNFFFIFLVQWTEKIIQSGKISEFHKKEGYMHTIKKKIDDEEEKRIGIYFLGLWDIETKKANKWCHARNIGIVRRKKSR